MNTDVIVEKTVLYVKDVLRNAEGGHDWWHIYRVWKLAKRIAQSEEGVNLLVLELGALLHDIADSKFHEGDESLGPIKASNFLSELHVEPSVITHVVQIIQHVSFKNSFEPQTFRSIELDIIQDADRLDALGAIGIARTFNYGGFKNRAIYDPNIEPNLHFTKEAYKNSTAPTINHFYEKLLKLKDQMNTKTGQKMAKRRHLFMEEFLETFYLEWNGTI